MNQSIEPSNTLLPAVANYLDQLNSYIIPMIQQTGSVFSAINAREGLANLTQTLVTEVVKVPLVIDEMIPFNHIRDVNNQSIITDSEFAYDVPVRIYHPNPEQRLPCLIYCHGGGSVAGSVSVYDGILRRLATYTQSIVIAPEYRLAPENPYPCAQIDVRTTLLGVPALLNRREIATTGEIIVAGDSHGGALVTNLLRDSSVQQTDIWHKLTAQILLYPSVDFTMSCPSMDTYAHGYLLSRERITWYFDQYFQHNERRQRQSALFSSREELTNQPPALIFNATFDPLYDEGVAYASKLRQAGVKVKHIEFDNVIHAYLNMENLNPNVCQQTYQAMAEFLSVNSV